MLICSKFGAAEAMHAARGAFGSSSPGRGRGSRGRDALRVGARRFSGSGRGQFSKPNQFLVNLGFKMI